MPQLATPTIPALKAKKYATRTIGDKEAEEIVALNSGGFYLGEISEVTGRSEEQIETCLWNLGFSIRSHKYEQAEIQTWIQFYSGEFDGLPMTFAEIARRTGYATGTIQIAILRAGVRDRHPAESRRLAWERKKKERKH